MKKNTKNVLLSLFIFAAAFYFARSHQPSIQVSVVAQAHATGK